MGTEGPWLEKLCVITQKDLLSFVKTLQGWDVCRVTGSGSPDLDEFSGPFNLASAGFLAAPHFD